MLLSARLAVLCVSVSLLMPPRGEQGGWVLLVSVAHLPVLQGSRRAQVSTAKDATISMIFSHSLVLLSCSMFLQAPPAPLVSSPSSTSWCHP